MLLTTCNPKVMSGNLSMPDATSLHHCLKNKQLILNAYSSKDLVKGVLHLLYGKEMAYTLQPRFYKVGYRPVSVQCLNSMYNIDGGFGGSDVGM